MITYKYTDENIGVTLRELHAGLQAQKKTFRTKAERAEVQRYCDCIALAYARAFNKSLFPEYRPGIDK